MIYLTYLKTSHFNLKSNDVEPMLNSDNGAVFLLRGSCSSDFLVYTNKTYKEKYLEHDVSCCRTNVSSLCTREKQKQMNMQTTQSTQNEEEDEEDIPTERNEVTSTLNNRDRHFVKYKSEPNSCRAQQLKGTLNKKISKIKGKKKITKQDNRSNRKHQLLTIKNTFKGKIILNNEKWEKLIPRNCSKNAKRGFMKERKLRKKVHAFEKEIFLNTVENFLALRNSALYLKIACENFFKFCKDNLESSTAQKCLPRVRKDRVSKGGERSVDILDNTEKYPIGYSPYLKCIEYNTKCTKRDEGRRLTVRIKKKVVKMEYFTCTKRNSQANDRGKMGPVISKKAQSNSSFHKRNNTKDMRFGRPNKESLIVVHQVVMDVYNLDMHYQVNCMEPCKGTPSLCVLFLECCLLKYNFATTNCSTKLRSIPNVNQNKQKNKIKKNKKKKKTNKNKKEKTETIADVVDFLNHLSSAVPQIKNNRSFISLAISTIMCKTYNVRGTIMEFFNSTNKKYHGICPIGIARIISIPYCMQRDTHQCIRNDVYYELYQAIYLGRHCYVIFQKAIISSFCSITHQQSFLCVQNCLENCITEMGPSFCQKQLSTFAIFRAVSNAISIATTVSNKLPFPKLLFFRKYKILVTQYQNIVNYAIFFLHLCEHIITHHFKKRKILLRTKEKISLLLYYFGDRHGLVKYQRKHFFHHICRKRCSKQEKYCQREFLNWLSDQKLEGIKSEVEINFATYLQHFKDKKGETEKSHHCVHQNEMFPHHQNNPRSSLSHHTILYYAMKKLILYFCHYLVAPSDTIIKYRNVCKKRHKLKKPSAGASECSKNFLHIHVIHTFTDFLKRDFVKLAYARKRQWSSFHAPSDRNANSIYSSSSGSSRGSTHENSLKNRTDIDISLHARQQKNEVVYIHNCTLKSEERGKRTCTSDNTQGDHTQRNKSNNSHPRIWDRSEDRHSKYLKFQVKGKLTLHVMHRSGNHKKHSGSSDDNSTNHTHKPNGSRRNIAKMNPNGGDHYYIEKESFTKLHNNVVRGTDQMENKMNYTRNYTHPHLNNCMNNRHIENYSNTSIIIIRDQLTRSIEPRRYHRSFCTGCQNILHHNMNHMSSCHNGHQIRWQKNPSSFMRRERYMHGHGNYGCGNGFNSYCRSNYGCYFHSSNPHRGYHQNGYHHNGYCYNCFLHNSSQNCYCRYLNSPYPSSNNFMGRNSHLPQYGNSIFLKSSELSKKEKKDIIYYFNVFFNNTNNSYFSRTVDKNKETNCTHRYTKPHQNNGPPNYYTIPNGVYIINNNNLNKQNKLCKICKNRSVSENQDYSPINRIDNSFEAISSMKKDPNVHNTNGGVPVNNYLKKSRSDEQYPSNKALNNETDRGMLPRNCKGNLPNGNTHVLNKSSVLSGYRNCNNVNLITNIFCMCGAKIDVGDNQDSDRQGGNNQTGHNERADNEGGGKDEGIDNQRDKEGNEGDKKSGADNSSNGNNKNKNNSERSGRANGDNSNDKNKDDDNERKGNDQNRRGFNEHNTCITTRKKKKSKKKKTEKRMISYQHKNIQKRSMLNSKCTKGGKKKNNRFSKSKEEDKNNKIDNKKEDTDNAVTSHSGNRAKKDKFTNDNLISSKATSSVKESQMKKFSEGCNSFKQYLEFVKTIDYDIKFGNAFVKLGKKLSSQNKCQFDVYEAEVVAMDNISSFFYSNIQNFESFYSLLKRNINSYDFLKTNIYNQNYGENLEIDDSNVEDFLKHSQDSNLILKYFTNTINVADEDSKDSSTNSKNSPSRKRSFSSYINLPQGGTSKQISNDQSNPVQAEMPKKAHINNVGSTHENISSIKNCKNAGNNVVDSTSNSNANTNDVAPSHIYTPKIVKINMNENAKFSPSANKNADSNVRPEGSNSTNRDGALITDGQPGNAGLAHLTALPRVPNHTHSNTLRNKMSNKGCSTMKKERESFSICRDNNNGINSINGNSPNSGSNSSAGVKLANLSSSNQMANLSQNGHQNFRQNCPEDTPHNALCKSLIEAINRIKFLKISGYKSLYDLLKDQCRVLLVQKMTTEANTMYNIIKHVIRYDYINDAINNPFTIYQHSTKDILADKFAIKILNTSTCGIYKLKYKIHSLLSEGKQLKNVNIEIENYAKRKYQSQEHLRKCHEQSVKNILQSEKATQFDSLSTLNISSSDLSSSQYLESYKKFCSQKDTTTNNHLDVCRSKNKHLDSGRSSNENLDLYLSDILSIRNLMNNTLSPNNDMHPCNYEQQPKYNCSMEVDKTSDVKNICGSNGLSSTTTNTKQNSISSNNLTSELSQIPIGDISTTSPNNAIYPFICKYCLNIFFDKDMASPNDGNKSTLNKTLLNIYAEKNNEDNHVCDTITAKKKKLTAQYVDISGHSCVSKSGPRVKENNHILQVDSNERSKEENEEIGRTKNATSNSGNELGSRSIENSRGTHCNPVNTGNPENRSNRSNRNNSRSIYLDTRNNMKRESIRRKRKQIANNSEKEGKNKNVRNKRVTKKETKLKTKYKIINKRRRGINAKKGKKFANFEVKNKLTDTANDKNRQQNNTSINTQLSKISERGCKPTSPVKREMPQSVVSCISSPRKNLRQNYDLQNPPLNIQAPDSCPNHNMNNPNKMKINVCKRCKEKNAPRESPIAKEILKKNKKHPGSVPKYLWSSVGITKNSEHVLGVAMQMIDGCTLTYIIHKLKGTENVKQGQFLLDICNKLVKHLMIVCESVDNPIINWDTKPGNIMIEYETGMSKIVCKNVTIIDVGDALPGRRFYFPTNPAYYEKIKINNSQKNFNNFLYYVICTKGFCSPECALLVFLLSSLNKSEQFRKTWYGPDSNIFHIIKTRQLRIKHRWKKLLDLRFIQPIVRKKDFMLSGQSFSPVNRKCPCTNEEDDAPSVSYMKRDSTYCGSVTSYNRRNSNRNGNRNNSRNSSRNNNRNSATNNSRNGARNNNRNRARNNNRNSTFSSTRGNNTGSKITIQMERNTPVPHPVNVKVDLPRKHPNMTDASGNGTIRNSNNDNSLRGNPISKFPNSVISQDGNSYNSRKLFQEERDNKINGNKGHNKISSNPIRENQKSVPPGCKPIGLVAPNANSGDANADSSEKRATSRSHHPNSEQEDILRGHYLLKICTHDMKDDGALEHYSDNEEIKEFLIKKDEKIKEMEIKLSESEKKKRKKRENEYFKMQNIDSWVVKFTTETTVFSVGLVLCQLFGGNNLLSVVNKDEVKVVDVLCEWNCKNSTNIYSGEKNVTINDLLPSRGIFADVLWKRKIKKIIKKCLQFVPSRRCSFKELYEDVKNLKREFEAYYNLKDDSTCDQ
ncbi:hypothetical protein C922_01470 [Plasmodium inui San Antonio 1]|uniref:Uncharacterized protein n=1 Tax=Plasmodium inui San Antonio 1 TaxID=1237626 RepID=W7A9B3_9APIC|nr:hypothetical protein C922_01470 [Plasmodium inui San Antonio 1]EUD67858.1 hypothetical protein C922_01470 [Plasmodium inui San Antonio 1]